MTANNPAQSYLQQQVQTASREQLLLMLYDGAIRFLKVARKGMEAQDVEKAHQNLIRGQRIVSELMASLDVKLGGEPARNLMNLYEYLYYRLVQANLKKDVAMLDEVLEHLAQLRQTWEEAIRIAAREGKEAAKGLPVGQAEAQGIDGAVRYEGATPSAPPPGPARSYAV